MADIELVIKIDDKVYEYIKSIPLHTMLEEAVIEGTPLPKSHGRLIDADALKKDDEVTEWCSRNAIRTGKMLKSFSELFIKKIDATPTIIEADIPTMYYPQVEGITPTIIEADKEETTK